MLGIWCEALPDEISTKFVKIQCRSPFAGFGFEGKIYLKVFISRSALLRCLKFDK